MNNGKIFVGQLVESWARGFGRIIDIWWNDTIAVKFSYTEEPVYYDVHDQCVLKFFNKEETAYIEP